MFFATQGFVNAQGTLQFNSVIFEQFSQTTNSGSSEHITNSQFTVGAGQVAKLVSCSFSRNGVDDIGGSSAAAWIELDNMVIVDFNSTINFPVWLEAGTYNISIHNLHNNNSILLYCQYSIIVFDVVQ